MPHKLITHYQLKIKSVGFIFKYLCLFLIFIIVLYICIVNVRKCNDRVNGVKTFYKVLIINRIQKYKLIYYFI